MGAVAPGFIDTRTADWCLAGTDVKVETFCDRLPEPRCALAKMRAYSQIHTCVYKSLGDSSPSGSC